jgi:hypothetical protein
MTGGVRAMLLEKEKMRIDHSVKPLVTLARF